MASRSGEGRSRDGGARATAGFLRRKPKGSGGELQLAATHTCTALEALRHPSVFLIRSHSSAAPVVAVHDAIGSSPRDAARASLDRVPSDLAGLLRPRLLAGARWPFRPVEWLFARWTSGV